MSGIMTTVDSFSTMENAVYEDDEVVCMGWRRTNSKRDEWWRRRTDNKLLGLLMTSTADRGLQRRHIVSSRQLFVVVKTFETRRTNMACSTTEFSDRKHESSQSPWKRVWWNLWLKYFQSCNSCCDEGCVVQLRTIMQHENAKNCETHSITVR